MKLAKLPEELYPIRVGGKTISGAALSRLFALEKRLHHVRNTKLLKGVQERIQTLTDEMMSVAIGECEDNRDEFLKNQVPGHEKNCLTTRKL